MKKKLLIQSIIKTIIAYLIFLITYLIKDFYLAQNITIIIGVIYISLAWVNYLIKDNFLKKNEKIIEDTDLLKNESRKTSIYSYIISSVLILLLGLI